MHSVDLQQNRDVPHLVACDPFAYIYEKLDCISQLGTITSRQSPGSGWKNIASVVTVKPKECQPAKKGGRKQEREERGCNFFPFSFATANEQLLPAVLGPCPLFPLGTTNPDHGSLWRNGTTVKSRSNKMTWGSFPQVSQPGQACVCPPASMTVDSRHTHTRPG